MGQGTLLEVWDGSGTHPKDWKVSGDWPGAPVRVGGPSWRSGTIWKVFWKVWDGRVVLSEVQDRSGGPLESS